MELDTIDSDEEDNDDDLFESENFKAPMDDGLGEVSDIINCLKRISMTFRSPARSDRIKYAESADTKHFEPHDIDHVKIKYTKLPAVLSGRHVFPIATSCSSWKEPMSS